MDPALKAKLKRCWDSPWWKVALSIGLIGVLVYEQDFRKLSSEFRNVDPYWAALGLLMYVVSQVVCVSRWQMLAKPLGLEARYRDFFGAYFTGLFLNLFGPSTVNGDVARTLFLAGSEQRKSLALVSVLAERGIGLLTLVWVAAIGLAVQPEIRLPAILRYGAWCVAPLTVVGWFVLPTVALRLFPRSERLRRFVEVDLIPYRRDWRLFLRANLASLLFHALNIGSQIPLAWALGINIPAGYVYLFVPIVNVLGMAPISFNGIGIRETGYRYFLSRVGVGKPAAVALGMLSSTTVLASGLIGGLVYVTWQSRKKLAGSSAATEGS